MNEEVSPVSVFLMWTTWGSRILSEWLRLFRIGPEGFGVAEIDPAVEELTKRPPPPLSTAFKCFCEECWGSAFKCWGFRSIETFFGGASVVFSGNGNGNGGVNSCSTEDMTDNHFSHFPFHNQIVLFCLKLFFSSTKLNLFFRFFSFDNNSRQCMERKRKFCNKIACAELAESFGLTELLREIRPGYFRVASNQGSLPPLLSLSLSSFLFCLFLMSNVFSFFLSFFLSVFLSFYAAVWLNTFAFPYFRKNQKI